MFELKENDIVVFNRCNTLNFIVTITDKGPYLTYREGHGILSHYTSEYGSSYKVYRSKRLSDTALVKRKFCEQGWNPSELGWIEQVYPVVKEYTMEELQKLVGHEFKLVKS